MSYSHYASCHVAIDSAIRQSKERSKGDEAITKKLAAQSKKKIQKKIKVAE
ncbi:MAG: hypothetical protein R8K20_03045 [Gallionellaceae bacterium]